MSGSNPHPDVFKSLIANCFKAWDSLNPDNAAKFYSQNPNLIFYDISPLKYKGWKEYSEGIRKEFFENILSSNVTMHEDLRVTRREDNAWATVTFHISARMKNGKKLEEEGRYTAIFEKTEKRWLIVHDHWSIPYQL